MPVSAGAAPIIQAMVTLVLLPGMDGSGDLFESFVIALRGRVKTRVVRYPDDASATRYDDLVELAANALPRDEPFVLVGESFSGPVAVSLAARRPQGLAGLVLCATFVRNPRPLFGGLRGLLGFIPALAPPLAPLHFALLGRFATPASRAAFRAAMAQARPMTLRDRLQAVLGVDVSARLAGVDVPMLYLRATQDRVVPASAGRLIERLRPDMQVETMDAPHFLLQAAPEAAADAIVRFVECACRDPR